MCAAMVGADPDALDALASAFERQAGSLDAMAGRIRSQVATSPWAGNRANRFRSEWDNTHMPRLRSASSALRAGAKQLRTEATQQRQASSVRGGGGGHAVGGSGRSGGTRASNTGGEGVSAWSWDQAWQGLQNTYGGKIGFAGLGVAGALATLGANASLVGRYAGGTPAAFFRYKARLNGPFSVNGLGEMVDNIPGLSKVGAAAGYVDLAANTTAFVHKPDIWNGLAVVESGLKTSKHPMVYLSGVALSSVDMAAKAASETDWSPETFSSTTNYLKKEGWNAPKVVLEELWNATKDVAVNRIWNIF